MIDPDDEELRGLAGERTDLAWSRSALAVLAAAGAIVKEVLDGIRRPTASTVVAVLLAVGGVAWVVALTHGRALDAASLEGVRHPDARVLRAVAYGTATFGAAALVLALVSG